MPAQSVEKISTGFATAPGWIFRVLQSAHSICGMFLTNKNVQGRCKRPTGRRASLVLKYFHLKKRFRHKHRLYLQRDSLCNLSIFFPRIVFSRKWVQISTEKAPETSENGFGEKLIKFLSLPTVSLLPRPALALQPLAETLQPSNPLRFYTAKCTLWMHTIQNSWLGKLYSAKFRNAA